MSYRRNLKQADVNLSSSGDNIVIAAVAGAPVRVYQVWLEASGGANNLIFKDGTTALNASALQLANLGSVTFQDTGQEWWRTLPGNAFSINLSTATGVTGRLYYTQGG